GAGNGEGGSSLTITGTLANTKNVQIGNGDLSAPTTLTLGGLSNGDGTSFFLNGSPSARAKLAFSGSGSGFTKNGGDFGLSYAAPLSLVHAFTNTGTFRLHNATALRVSGGFANSGALSLDDSDPFLGAGNGEGGSSLTITGTLANTKNVQIGNGDLSAPTTLTLGGLSNTANISLFSSDSAEATLTVTGGTATNTGTIANTGPMAIGLRLTGSVAARNNAGGTISGDRYGVDGSGSGVSVTNFGSIADGSADGAGVLLEQGAGLINGTAASPAGLVAGGAEGVLLGSGGGRVTNFATISGAIGVGARSGSSAADTVTNGGTITGTGGTAVALGAGNDRLAVATGAAFHGIVDGGAGSDEADFLRSGAVDVGGFVGFETIGLAGGGADTLVLDDANFAGGGARAITIDGGDHGNRIDASSLSAPNRVVVNGGGGLDNLKGGAGGDTFNLSPATSPGSTAAGNGGNDTFNLAIATLPAVAITGGSGSDTLSLSDAGSFAAPKVGGVERFALASTGNNRLTLLDANFAGTAGNKVTVAGGSRNDTVDAGGLSAGHGVAFDGGAGNDNFIAKRANLAISTFAGRLGSDRLTLADPGTVSIAHVAGVETIHLADGGADSVSVQDANFAGLAAGASIRVIGGARGNTVDAAALAAAHSVVIDGGGGADSLKGGAGGDTFNLSPATSPGSTVAGNGGNDTFNLGAATLAAAAINGGGGTDTASLADAGNFLAPKTRGVERFALAGAGSNRLTLLDVNFAGTAGNKITATGGGKDDTVDVSSLSAGHAVAFSGGLGNDSFIIKRAALAASTFGGGAGSDTLALGDAGLFSAPGVSAVERYLLSSAGNNMLTLLNANFAGISGTKLTVVGGDKDDAVDAGGLSAGRVVVFDGGTGDDEFIVKRATLAISTLAGGVGSDTLTVADPGAVSIAHVRGVETVELADGGANGLTLQDASFAGVTGRKITVFLGDGDNTIDAHGLSAADRIIVRLRAFRGGRNVLTGGAGNDEFRLSRAALASVAVAGGGGIDSLVLTSPGTIDLGPHIIGVETIRLSSNDVNSLRLIDANFTGAIGGKITVAGGGKDDTLDLSIISAGKAVAFDGGGGDDALKVKAATLALSTFAGGPGSDALTLADSGTIALGGVSGVETIALQGLAANTLTLTDANFADVAGRITVRGGGAGNAIDASALSAGHGVNISGGAGVDRLKGGGGSDLFRLSTTTLANAATAVDGGAGNDTLRLIVPGTIPVTGVSGIESYILSNAGSNTLTLAADNFSGTAGKTITVHGGDAGNAIDASPLPAGDTAILVGGAGADTFVAGGSAKMTGGGGADDFELTRASATTNTIAGFASGTDRIGFDHSAFGLSLSPLPQPLPDDLFVENAAGSFEEAGQRFAYSASSGDLFFDADGSGSVSAAVKIAHLDGHPSLVATDLFVF
ncbi:MAG TPA: hypothetical protein VFQ80_02020, partial [Thermomicrobiales bacterium]|nr:hypothetical protein [Thermomicrobiales bacterium]